MVALAVHFLRVIPLRIDGMSRYFMNELKQRKCSNKGSLISHTLLLANLNMVCNSFSFEFLIFHDT